MYSLATSIFFELFGIAAPVVGENGLQLVENGKPVFGEAGNYGLLTVLSTLSWGLGYFGMPQVLLRFMAARKTSEITMSRRIATVWVIISLAAAVAIGIIGRALLPTEEVLLYAGLTSYIDEDTFSLIQSLVSLKK